MEDSMSQKRSLAPGPEQNQDPLDISSQASATAEEKGEPANEDAKPEEAEKSVKAASEFKKTWGFRRTTIAKREMPGDTDSPEGRNAPVRRSGRQAKRTDKMEEFLSTAKRGRGGRRSAPAHLEASDPPSQTPTDAETASEASFDGSAETKAADDKKSPERLRGRRKKMAPKPKSGSVSDNGSSENENENEDEDNEEMQASTEKTSQEVDKTGEPEVQEEADKKDEEKEEEEKPATESRPVSGSPARAASRDSTPVKRKVTRSRGGRKVSKDRKGGDDDSDEDEDSSDESDNGGYDPNALYCICRQKHNKRFMICCDRCEEWFHGDCVGITEARGRLLERNGEDYICPNCTVQKSRSTSPASASESDKRPTRKTGLNSTAEQTAAPAGVEDKPGEDLGIKGRIEKATNPSGKKKIKIFQPAVEPAAAAAAAAATAAATATTAGALPKCIGPGCGKNALPDSVYCGNDCILRHAAAAMKSITDVKETKPKEKPKPKGQKKPTTRSAVKKRSGPERTAGRRSTESSGQPEDDDDSDSEDDEEEKEEGEGKEQEPAIASWSSDHNYNAVTPEKTAPNASSVFNKSCMYLLQVFQTPDIIFFSNSWLV